MLKKIGFLFFLLTGCATQSPIDASHNENIVSLSHSMASEYSSGFSQIVNKVLRPTFEGESEEYRWASFGIRSDPAQVEFIMQSLALYCERGNGQSSVAEKTYNNDSLTVITCSDKASHAAIFSSYLESEAVRGGGNIRCYSVFSLENKQIGDDAKFFANLERQRKFYLETFSREALC